MVTLISQIYASGVHVLGLLDLPSSRIFFLLYLIADEIELIDESECQPNHGQEDLSLCPCLGKLLETPLSSLTYGVALPYQGMRLLPQLHMACDYLQSPPVQG